MSLYERATRPLREFLALPLCIVLVFMVLAVGVDWLDNHAGPRPSWTGLHRWLSQFVGDTQSAIGMLAAIASSLITVTSITFSILLLAVQQGAAVLNAQVVDHYFRRAANRGWLGFFVGVSVFVLITLVQTTHTTAPILGVAVSTLLGAASLLALMLLIYSTIDQTRPATVVATIHDAARAARQAQLDLLARCAEPTGARDGRSLLARTDGYLGRPDAERLERLLKAHGCRLTVEIRIGDYLPLNGRVATLHGGGDEALADQLAAALPLTTRRDVRIDADYSLDNLATIGWSAISTAKSDPAVGTIVIHALHDLLHRWAAPPPRAAPGTALIHYGDRLVDDLLDALEGLVIAAGESRQHQSLAALLGVLAESLPWLPQAARARVEGMAPLVLATLRDHQRSSPLRRGLARFAEALERGANPQLARPFRALDPGWQEADPPWPG